MGCGLLYQLDSFLALAGVGAAPLWRSTPAFYYIPWQAYTRTQTRTHKYEHTKSQVVILYSGCSFVFFCLRIFHFLQICSLPPPPSSLGSSNFKEIQFISFTKRSLWSPLVKAKSAQQGIHVSIVKCQKTYHFISFLLRHYSSTDKLTEIISLCETKLGFFSRLLMYYRLPG